MSKRELELCTEVGCHSIQIEDSHFCALHTVYEEIRRQHDEEMLWDRYLTDEEKERRIQVWKMAEEAAEPWIEKEAQEWVEKLNDISGLVVIQCCTGHPQPQEGGTWNMGFVWLRLDEAMNRMFRTYAYRLSCCHNIASVALVYDPHDGDVAAINFVGAEMGHLDSSMSEVYSFFLALTDKADVYRRTM